MVHITWSMRSVSTAMRPSKSTLLVAIILIFLCRTHHFPLPYTDGNVARINDIITQFRSNTRTVQERIESNEVELAHWPIFYPMCLFDTILSGIYRKNTQSDVLRREKRLRLLWSHLNIIWQIQLKKPLSNTSILSAQVKSNLTQIIWIISFNHHTVINLLMTS